MSPFWSNWIIVLSVLMMVACLWLLFANARGTPGENTGHVWDDDLREYNNPLPRWWLNLFVITVIFAAIYLALYPGLGNLSGKLGWTSTGEMNAKLNEYRARRHAAYTALAGKDIPALAHDSTALGLGRAALDLCFFQLALEHLARACGTFGGEPVRHCVPIYQFSPEV